MIGFFGALDEGVELHKSIRSAGRGHVGRRGIRGCKLSGEIGEVSEGELARVGAVADCEKDERGLEEVAKGALSVKW